MPNFLEKIWAKSLRDPVQIIAMLALAAAVLIGGGGANGPFNNGVLSALGAILLAAVLASHFTGSRPLPGIALWPSLFMLGLLALGLYQLWPQDGAPWADLPGRATEAQLMQFIGSEARPLSLDVEATQRFLAAYCLPFALLLAVLGGSKTQVRALFVTLLVCAGLHVALAIIQIALGLPMHLRFYSNISTSYATGFFANANHFGTFLVLTVLAAVSVSLLRHSEDEVAKRRAKIGGWLGRLGPLRTFILLLIPLVTIIVVASSTRAGVILLAIALPVALIAMFELRFSRSLLAIGIFSPLLVVLMIALFPGGGITAFTDQFWSSGNIRFEIYPDLVYVLESFWQWGVGMGAFDGAFRANENLDLVGPFFINHAHNDWMEWVIEMGLPGAILLGGFLLILLVQIFAAWRRIADRSIREFYLMMIGIFAMLVIGAHSAFDYPARIATIGVAFALFLGLTLMPWTANRRSGAMQSTVGKYAIWASLLVVGFANGFGQYRLFAAEAAYVGNQPALAVSLNRWHGEAMAQLAARAATADQTEEAKRQAVRAILSRPYTASAVRSLAVAIEKEGEPANGAWPLASMLGWRDPPTQQWAFVQAASNGQFDVAAVRADALMRTGKSPEQFEEGLFRLFSIEDFRLAMAERLMKKPTWRAAFLAGGPSEDPQAMNGAAAMLTYLSANGGITAFEARGTIARLIQQGRIKEAHDLYARIGSEGAQGAILTDGDFDQPAALYRNRLTPFDWTLLTGDGVAAEIEGRDDPKLYVETEGARKALVQRLVRLEAGTYQLSFVANDYRGEPGALRVDMRCIDAVEPVLTISLGERLDGELQQQFSAAGSCPVYRLSVLSSPADRRSSVLLDKFAIEKLR